MSSRATREEALDNPVWHGLRGPLARFASPDSSDDYVRFDPQVSVFGGVERIDDDTWPRIAAAVGVEGVCGLFRDAVPAPPEGWEEHFRGPCLQMVAGDLPPSRGEEVVRLGTRDVEEMLALVELTEPGPFLPRTHELGRYVGIRRSGRLVAMAGERFRIPGLTEISAVCSHPAVRGERLAGELTLNVAESIRARGDEAFLHVLDTNENAIRLYEKLGFGLRRRVDVVFAQWHGADGRPESGSASGRATDAGGASGTSLRRPPDMAL